MAWRNEPAPLSLAFRTVSTAALELRATDKTSTNAAISEGRPLQAFPAILIIRRFAKRLPYINAIRGEGNANRRRNQLKLTHDSSTETSWGRSLSPEKRA